MASAQNGRRLSAPISDLPALGFQNYWYPIIESSRVGLRPLAVRRLGEEIVLFRSGGKLGALCNRCPHRGASLSDGRILFPGTLSCGYHGWTFDLQGQCVGAIVEGPESPIARKMRTRSYPVEERYGVVWAYIGEGEPPPLDEDLPPEMSSANAAQIQAHFFAEEWACDWRTMSDNQLDMMHTAFVHRSSPMYLFHKTKAWGKMAVEPLPDGKGVRVRETGGAAEAIYPGLGKYPAKAWWRFIKGKVAAYLGAQTRMPGHITLNRPEPFLGFRITTLQWPVPIDEHHSQLFFFDVTYPKNVLQRIFFKLWFLVWERPMVRAFVNQDRRIVEGQIWGAPEKLSGIDVGVIWWRRRAREMARKPRPAQNGAGPSPAGLETHEEAAVPVGSG